MDFAGILSRELPIDQTATSQKFVDLVIGEAIRSAKMSTTAGDDSSPSWTLWEQNILSLREGERFLQDTWPKLLAKAELSAEERARAARILLEGRYPKYIKQRSVGGVMLTWYHDQATRFNWAVGATLWFLVSGLIVNMNATSIHGFYRRKIAECFVDHPDQGDAQFNSAKPADLLSDLDTVKHGGPYQIFSATLNLFNQMPWKLSEYSSAYTFIFSPHWCGAQPLRISDRRRLGYRRTSYYCGGELDIPTVVAISGAAFSPTVFRSPLLFFMSMLFNVRLGQWMPNPARSRDAVPLWGRLSKRIRVALARRYRRRRSVTMLEIMRDAFRTLRNPDSATDWRSIFISDGGHNDNLGISPLLFRRCRLMIVSDATGDPGYRFSDLLKTIRRCRLRSSIVFHVGGDDDEMRDQYGEGLGALRPRTSRLDSESWSNWVSGLVRRGDSQDGDGGERIDKLPRSSQHAILMEVEYPEKNLPKAYLLYIKSSMTGDEPADLRQWQADNPAFPHDPTTDQFFTENQVESYRQLGEHIGNELCEAIADRLRKMSLERENCLPRTKGKRDYSPLDDQLEEMSYERALGVIREARYPEHEDEIEYAMNTLADAYQKDARRQAEIQSIVTEKIKTAAEGDVRKYWEDLLQPLADMEVSSSYPLWDWEGPIDDLLVAIQEAMRPGNAKQPVDTKENHRQAVPQANEKGGA